MRKVATDTDQLIAPAADMQNLAQGDISRSSR